MMKIKTNNRWPFSIWQICLICLFLLGIWTRFFRLEILPFTRQYDELVYVLNAQSANLSGTNLNEDWKPWSFQPVMPMYSELSATLLMPWLQLTLPLKLKSLLPFALMSLLTPILLGLLTFELTKNKKAADFTFVIALFNPFVWQLGRIGIDCSWSFFLTILAMYLFLKCKNWRKLWSLPIFVLAFYQYQGYKILIPCLLAVLFFYQVIMTAQDVNKKWRINWQKLLPEITLVSVMVAVVAAHFLIALPNQSSSERLSKILSPTDEGIIRAVENDRNLTLTKFDRVFNPYTEMAKEMAARIFGTYNLTNLFWETGESNKMFYIVNNHGLFYLGDLFLIVAGIITLVKKKSWKNLLLLTMLMLVATTPELIADGQWYFYRTSFRVVPLLILAGVGAAKIWAKSKNWLKTILIIIYSLSVIHFAWLYFYQLPLKSTADTFFADRIVVEYLRRQDRELPTQIMSGDHRVTWMSYLYENDLLNKENIKSAQTMWQDEKFSWNQLTWGPNCFAASEATTEGLQIIAYDYRGCDDNAKSVREELVNAGINYVTIRSPVDDGDKYFIIGDTLCQGKDLAAGLVFKQWQDLDLTALSDDDFCRLWLSPKP